MSKQAREPSTDMRPDGWERFGRAVDAAVKGGPKHRPAKPKTRPASNVRARKSKSHR